MQEEETNKLRPKHIGSVYKSGSSNSKTCTIPNEYAEFAGIKGDGYVVMRPYCGPHGNYLVIHKQGNQPEEGVVEDVFIGYNELEAVEGDASSKQ